MSAGRDSKGAEWLAALALLACGALAIANLPHRQLPTGWLLAWTVPAALFGLLRRRPDRPWLRAVAASVAQALAFALALNYSDPLSRPAILACTILPPLTFVSIRRRAADAALGLFLSFCVLLVGVILGGMDVPLLAAYCVLACLALRSESHLAVLAISRNPRRGPRRTRALRPVLWTAIAIALPCLFTAFAIDRTLAWIPSPLRTGPETSSAAATANPSANRQGLSDSFDLGGGGLLSGLTGEQLVLVRTDNGSPTPSGLYLRSGFFSRPTTCDNWDPGPIHLVRGEDRADHVLRPTFPGVPEHWLEVERFAGARNHVFVPPTATRLREVPGLLFDRERMWLRQQMNGERTDYAVAYQDLRDPDLNAEVDRKLQGELLALPPDFDDDDRLRYEQLLDEWGANGPPWQIAQRIADGLDLRCRYDRVQPTGPYPHDLDNFLFSMRRGYCMHFASAATLMLRLRGIPCRIGTGLYGGDRDRREPEARVFGSQHSHAWVEIPFLRYGFVVFDPTPAEERGQRIPTQMTPEDDQGLGDPASPADATTFWGGLIDFLLQPWVLILALVMAVAATMWPGNRKATERIVMPRSMLAARRLLIRILRALAEAGHARRRGQTLEEFGIVLASRARLDPAVAMAFRTYQEVRFGGRSYDEQRERILLRGLDAAIQTEPWTPAESAGDRPTPA
ncbi:MAG: DUF4129 domain-containing protein [Planctomycetes bacterium]|nr:DUF4129 domain-containing protein [Planctomycetota bacterium]